MTNVPIGMETYQRKRASEPDIRFINRFYEKDPTDQVNGVAAIRRPGLNPRIEVGDGPIRRIFWQSGFSDDALFIVSKNNLYRLTNTPTEGDKLTLLTGSVFGTGTPYMVARNDYLFIADGVTFQYTDGTSELTPIPTPDDVVILTLAVQKDFVLCTVSQDLATGHRGDQFYWIEPAEVTIDPLNFATAESSPDIIVQAMALGDNAWFFGKDSTEVWYATGDLNAPFAPISGRPFNHGAWGGTPALVNDQLLLIGADGKAYSVTDGATPISEPGIEERIARAMKIQLLDE